MSIRRIEEIDKQLEKLDKRLDEICEEIIDKLLTGNALKEIIYKALMDYSTYSESPKESPSPSDD